MGGKGSRNGLRQAQRIWDTRLFSTTCIGTTLQIEHRSHSQRCMKSKMAIHHNEHSIRIGKSRGISRTPYNDPEYLNLDLKRHGSSTALVITCTTPQHTNSRTKGPTKLAAELH